MTAPAVAVEGVSKRYHLGEEARGGHTLREALRALPARLAGGLGATARAAPPRTELWALDDVSFDIAEGELVGLVGRNGAGKTTLLKVLSRITPPTRGRIALWGRVGALLEVGTGFHPELSGRENIFLNGAILGMRRAEIHAKFDEIVAFAEVERFIDTPVKRYSSGMYVRLAFAVAAHFEPEILVVDEVLAVGDLAFQKKCLGKMDDVAHAGRTVIFVSHNLQAIRSLCPRTVVLEDGRVVADGPTEASLATYRDCLRRATVDETAAIHDESRRRGSGAVRFSSLQMVDADGAAALHIGMGDPVRFVLGLRVREPVEDLWVSIAFRSGLTGAFVSSVLHRLSDRPLPVGWAAEVELVLPSVDLRPGEYPIYFWAGNAHAQPYDVVDDLVPPLVVAPVAGDPTELGFHPASPIGYVSLPSHVSRLEPVSGESR